jgi:hypothetical protein
MDVVSKILLPPPRFFYKMFNERSHSSILNIIVNGYQIQTNETYNIYRSSKR